jgi:hypothetical protein
MRRLIRNSFLNSCSEQGLANTMGLGEGRGRQLSSQVPSCKNLGLRDFEN